MAALEEGGPPPPYEERRKEGGSFFVRAMYDFASPDSSSLSFERGQLIEVLTQLDSGWWDGLMGEDVRGWFPSNYVEIISEEEAQEELRAQGFMLGPVENDSDGEGDLDHEDGLRDVSNVYRRLGIDSELDGMQQLMTLQQEEVRDSGDAFEQLAEASMLDQASRNDGPDSLAALRAARRRSRMSEASGLESVGAQTSLTDLSLQQSRSAATSLTEADQPNAIAALAAHKQMLRAGPSDRERDRLRSQSIGVAGNQAGAQLRPRASTNVGAGSGSPSDSSASTPRENVSASGSRRRQGGPKEETENWLPKLTSRGEIVYVNIRTGREVSEIPLDGADAFAGSSNQTSEDETYHSDYSGSNAEASVSATKGSSALASNPRGAHRLRDGSMSSSNTANGASTVPLAKRNPVEAMPNPTDVLKPWKLRLTSDERSYFFYNIETQETRYDAPPQALRSLASVLRTGSLESLEELADEVTGRTTGQSAQRSRSGSQSGDSEVEGSLPGKSPRLLYEARQRTKTLVTPASLLDAPHSMLNDEQEALDLQNALEAPPPNSARLLVEHADRLINAVLSVAAEPVGVDGKSELDHRHGPTASSLLHETTRLGIATREAVHAVRDVLYAACALGMPQTELLSLSELVSLFDSQAPTSALHALQTAIAAVTTKGPGATHEDALIATALQQALPTPPTLLVTGSKVTAVVSKLLLSVRAVIEQPAPDTAANRNAERDEAYVEKLTSYRQRVREEAVDLAKVLSAFAAELYQAKNARNHSAASAPWTRRTQGVLASGRGTAGVGLEILGGGSAAGWRGSGFVLPNATEAAALRAESLGSFQNPFELTRDAQSALASGKVAMRRKPTQPLSKALLEERLQAQHDDLIRQLDDLARIIQSGGAPQGDRSPRSSQPPLGLKADTAAQRLSRSGVQMLTSQARFILIRFGTIMTLVEELDIAAVIDVDGPVAPVGDEVDEERRRLMVSVVNARLALHALSSVKQGAYDCSSNLMMDVQDASCESSSAVLDIDLLERMLLHARALANLTGRQLGLLHDLADIAEEQASESMQSIGARSKVYGSESVNITLKNPMHDSQDGGGDEVMYLGPGLSVPNGPGVSRGEARTSAAGSSKSSMAPSVRSGLGMRTRSTSVTTGASIGSQESSSRFLPRRGTDATADSDSMDAARSKSASKMKRFFGDDPLVPPPGTPQSDALASKANAEATHPPSANPGYAAGLAGTKPAEEVAWFLEPDYAPQDLVFNAAGQVKGATLGALMERLTMHNTFDPTFNNTFLMTYRSFTTTETFLDLLFARFRIRMPPGLSQEEQTVWTEKKQTPIRLRVFNVLKSWIESHFHEGEDDDHLKRIKEFALDEMAQSLPMETPSKLLIRLVERKQGDGEQMIRKMVMPNSAPQPIMPKNSRKVKFLEIDPLEMARQLTLIDSRLYNQIRPVECLGKAWSQSNGETIAKGIRDSISANNRVSGWVSESVLSQEDLKKRAAYVKHFVAIADRCFALNNFSSMMAIYSGLNNAALNRLRRTWDAVNQRHLAMFENMRVTLAPTKNFSRYRHTLRQLNPPCVPFLGVYLTDLTFIEDGNSDHLKTDERLINFSKRQMTAEKIGEIMIYQSTPYNLTPVQPIQKFIEESMVDSRGDDELFEQSLRLEPREREDEKIARLLQESGFL